jgi:hypothetical protein
MLRVADAVVPSVADAVVLCIAAAVAPWVAASVVLSVADAVVLCMIMLDVDCIAPVRASAGPAARPVRPQVAAMTTDAISTFRLNALVSSRFILVMTRIR